MLPQLNFFPQSRNFGMEYGRCQNEMEWKISRIEWKKIFHTSMLIAHKARTQKFAVGRGCFGGENQTKMLHLKLERFSVGN